MVVICQSSSLGRSVSWHYKGYIPSKRLIINLESAKKILWPTKDKGLNERKDSFLF